MLSCSLRGGKDQSHTSGGGKGQSHTRSPGQDFSEFPAKLKNKIPGREIFDLCPISHFFQNKCRLKVRAGFFRVTGKTEK